MFHRNKNKIKWNKEDVTFRWIDKNLIFIAIKTIKTSFVIVKIFFCLINCDTSTCLRIKLMTNVKFAKIYAFFFTQLYVIRRKNNSNILRILQETFDTGLISMKRRMLKTYAKGKINCCNSKRNFFLLHFANSYHLKIDLNNKENISIIFYSVHLN